MQSAKPDAQIYWTTIHTAKNEHVMAVMRGTLVQVERMEDNTFTMTVQRASFMTVYRHVTKPLKNSGVNVEAGEVIGVMDGKKDLELAIWDDGTFINPQEVIVW